MKTVAYDFGEDGILLLIPQCLKCGRFCKTDEKMSIAKQEKKNATCKKCGRVQVTSLGFI